MWATMVSRHILALSPARPSIRSAHPNLDRSDITHTHPLRFILFSLSLSLHLIRQHAFAVSFSRTTVSFLHFPSSLPGPRPSFLRVSVQVACNRAITARQPRNSI